MFVPGQAEMHQLKNYVNKDYYHNCSFSIVKTQN